MATNGPNRTKSVKTAPGGATTARASAKKSGAKDNKAQDDDDSKAETTALVDDLKEQLRKTETASEEYQKQLHVLQFRLDEAMAAQTELEETSNQHAETIAKLEADSKDAQRTKNDMQTKLESEQQSNNSEREAASTRETELTEVIARLKDSLAQRDSKQGLSGEGSLSRTASLRGRTSPNPEARNGPPALQRRDSSQNSAHLILQKDKVIEDLRMELAEAQIKVMEADRAGGGQRQALENQLLEARMSNAKLMEDNESYQFLLQEKTLSGDMANKFNLSTPSDQQHLSRAPSRDQDGGNLADELETVGEEDETGVDRKKLERELSAQKDQNKALTLYINRIIGKLLASENFEQLFENGTISANIPTPATEEAKSQKNKELPQVPSADGDGSKENAAPSLLARAGSIFGGRNKPPRPKSYQPPVAGGQSQPQAPTGNELDSRLSIDQPGSSNIANENPDLAPRLPLTRGGSARHSSNPRSHRRTTSEVSTGSTGGMYSSRLPSGALSPPLPSSKRSSVQAVPADLMASPDIPETAPAPSPSLQTPDMPELRPTSSATPSDSGYGDSITTPSSPPRSVGASSTDGPRASGGAATVSGRQMRPLRLVQEKAEFDAERKKANRGSWMGWFNKGPQPGGQPSGQQGQQPAGQARPGSQSQDER